MAANTIFLLISFLFLGPYHCYCQDNVTTTTTQAPVTEATPTEPPTIVPSNTDLAECTCDLTANGCDVNCCCDPECTDSDKNTFSSCVNYFNVVDNRACVRSDIIFTNNTEYVVEETHDGLFCIQYDNFEERNYYTAPDVITTEDEFDSKLQEYGRGYSFQQENSSSSVNTDYYRSGDPIYTVYETSGLGFLGLPAPLSSELCTDSNPAAYLYSQLFECTRELADLALECTGTPALDASTYYTGFKILTSPKAFEYLNETLTTTTTESPASTDSPLLDGQVSLFNTSYALRITPEGPHTCIDGGYNGTCAFADTDLPVPTYDAVTGCNSAVVKVTYKLTYNGTDGIANATVAFTFKNITENDLPLTQSFETQFVKDTENATFQRSGNPGYLPGEPVMAGFLVQQTNDNGDPIYAIDLDTNRNNWVTMVTSAANGECDSELTNRVPVTFDTSMRSGCFISVFFSNMTEACAQIHNESLTALRGPNPPDYVATFGNTIPENASDWVLMDIGNPPAASSSQNQGVCIGVVTGQHIEFIYTNVGSLANPQARIIGAKYQYKTQDIKYQCVGAYCMPGNDAPQRIEITSSVGFIDASTPAVSQSAGKPKVTARLPEDFFVPFS